MGLDAYDRTSPEPQNHIQLTAARTQKFNCVTYVRSFEDFLMKFWFALQLSRSGACLGMEFLKGIIMRWKEKYISMFSLAIMSLGNYIVYKLI